ANCPRKGAPLRQQPAPPDGQCDPDRACRLGNLALRSGAAAAGRAGIVARTVRQMAHVVRQSVGAGGKRIAALAARLDGARPEFVMPSVEATKRLQAPPYPSAASPRTALSPQAGRGFTAAPSILPPPPCGE